MSSTKKFFFRGVRYALSMKNIRVTPENFYNAVEDMRHFIKKNYGLDALEEFDCGLYAATEKAVPF